MKGKLLFNILAPTSAIFSTCQWHSFLLRTYTLHMDCKTVKTEYQPAHGHVQLSFVFCFSKDN